MELTLERSRWQLNWSNLLNLSVAANLIILSYMVAIRQDLLALALAAVLLLGLGLRRFRNGVLGLIVLFLINADIAVWTLSGAVNNFANNESLTAMLLPAYLGIISLLCVVTAVAVWRTRKNPQRGARAALIIGNFALALLALVTLAGFWFRTVPVTAVEPVDLGLTSQGMAFTQTELVAPSGEITLQLTNRDLWWHTFTIDELDIDLRVPMEAERAISFSAAPGTYAFYCSIPGHESIMRGTLVVEK